MGKKESDYFFFGQAGVDENYVCPGPLGRKGLPKGGGVHQDLVGLESPGKLRVMNRYRLIGIPVLCQEAFQCLIEDSAAEIDKNVHSGGFICLSIRPLLYAYMAKACRKQGMCLADL